MGSRWAAGKERWHLQLSEAGFSQSAPREQRNKTFPWQWPLPSCWKTGDEIHKQKGLFQQPLRSAQLPSPQELPFLGAKTDRPVLLSVPGRCTQLEGEGDGQAEEEVVAVSVSWPFFCLPFSLGLFP